MSTIAVKKVNQSLYRKVKALASLRGETVSEAVNEALGLWVQLAARGASVSSWVSLEGEAREDNECYESHEADLLAEHKGEFVAIGGGRVLGTFANPAEAYEVVRNAGLKHAIVTQVDEKPRETVELGWGLTEQLA
jgi:hypothetical protein